LILLLKPASNSCRAASSASWSAAFLIAPAMVDTPRCQAIRIAKGGRWMSWSRPIRPLLFCAKFGSVGFSKMPPKMS
jgi:hypothetical protein